MTSGPSTASFVGIWLIFGPGAIFTLLMLINAIRLGPVVDVITVASWCMMLFFSFIQSTILFRVTRSYLRYRRVMRGLCVKCSYELQGLSESRCPECGTEFEQKEHANIHRDDAIAFVEKE